MPYNNYKPLASTLTLLIILLNLAGLITPNTSLVLTLFVAAAYLVTQNRPAATRLVIFLIIIAIIATITSHLPTSHTIRLALGILLATTALSLGLTPNIHKGHN